MRYLWILICIGLVSCQSDTASVSESSAPGTRTRPGSSIIPGDTFPVDEEAAGVKYPSSNSSKKTDAPPPEKEKEKEDTGPVDADIQGAFRKIPAKYLKNSLGSPPTIVQRQEILNRRTQKWKDIIIDPFNNFVSYNKEKEDKGVITTIKSVPKKTNQFIVEHSAWGPDHIMTESIYFIELIGGKWTEVPHESVFPPIKLQNFFLSDISGKLRQTDHAYMPLLCYELPRKGEKMKVFLGEYNYQKSADFFKYEPDIAYLELEWQKDKFVLLPPPPPDNQ